MIPFFRKTRKKMADDNKPMKYMRYAIGEIVLVVVGILIALSINNWNIERKTRRMELSTLNELKQALIQDTIVLSSYIKELNKKSVDIGNLLSHIEDKKPYNQSLDTVFNSAYIHIGYKAFNLSAFDLLKERGIDIISNDKLRQQISKHYTIDYYRLIGWFERIEQINLIQGNKMYDNFRVSYDAIHPYHYEQLITKPELMGPFYHFQAMALSYKNQLTDFKEKSNVLMLKINTELKSRTENK